MGRAGASPGWPEPGPASGGAQGWWGPRRSPALLRPGTAAAPQCLWSPLGSLLPASPPPGLCLACGLGSGRTSPPCSLVSWVDTSPPSVPSRRGLLRGTCPFSMSRQRARAHGPVPTSPGARVPCPAGTACRASWGPRQASVAGGTTARSGARPVSGTRPSGWAERSMLGRAAVPPRDGAPSP